MLPKYKCNKCIFSKSSQVTKYNVIKDWCKKDENKNVTENPMSWKVGMEVIHHFINIYVTLQ